MKTIIILDHVTCMPDVLLLGQKDQDVNGHDYKVDQLFSQYLSHEPFPNQRENYLPHMA